MGGQYPQAAGYAPVFPQPVSGNVFDVGLGGPAIYAPPYMPMQNAQAGPSHLQPPQSHPGGMPPMAPPQYPPQHPGFIDLGDDVPQRSDGNAPQPLPEILSHRRALPPMRSDPAFNNIHHGHVAHRGREASHRQSLHDQEFLSLHQMEREAARWVIPDEQARHARNQNRRCMHLPDQPPPQLHMDMSREHEWRQQRIAALEPFCINPGPTSVPPQETSHQARECQERQQRIAELRTRRQRNESRRAASVQPREQEGHDQRMEQWMAQEKMRKDAQHLQDEMHREQTKRDDQLRRAHVERESQRVEDEMRHAHVGAEAQRLQDTMRREQQERAAQHMQHEMERAQARESQDHQQRIAQLEAQQRQNEIRRFENREAAINREEDEHLSQDAELFRRQQEAQADAIRREQQERDRLEAIAYDQARAAENAARIAEQAAEAVAQAQAEAAAQAQALADAHAQAQAAQQAAQAGQLDQFMENLRQQNLPPARKAYQEPLARHSLGGMTVECQHCHALHWDAEKLSASTVRNKKFGQCCLQGQIDLPPFPPPPPTLKNLLTGISPHSDTFCKHICQYNAAFAFTSLGVNIDHTVTSSSGPYAFKINGELHHLSGALLSEEGQQPRYAQLYIHDPAEALNIRGNRNGNLLPQIMTEL
jgi:hypothetical protein